MLLKITEKIVCLQLPEDLKNNNLFYLHQYAHRSCHSTETALFKIVNDLLTALDDSHISLLSLLDLSAAFDTIDHETLLSRLSHTFGISDTALSWFWPYLFNHAQVVSVNGNSSSPFVMKFGVPRGSVLGPVLFVLYTQPLSDIVHHHSLSHHNFYDENQLYESGHISQLQDIIRSTQTSVTSTQNFGLEVLDDKQ